MGNSDTIAITFLMIEFKSGDVLKAQETYIAQGVAEGNQEGLGTGLALKISTSWPEVQVKFKRYARLGRFRAGDIFVVAPTVSSPGLIYLATQPDMYHAKLNFLPKALKKLTAWCKEQQIDSVALPKIGAGLGKLDWEGQVKPLFIEYLSDSSCRFVVYEDYVYERDSGDD